MKIKLDFDIISIFILIKIVNNIKNIKLIK